MASAFAMYVGQMTEMFYPEIEVSVIGEFNNHPGLLQTKERQFVDSAVLSNFTARLRDFPDTTAFGVGLAEVAHEVTMPREMLTEKMRQALTNFGYQPDAKEYVLTVAIMTADEENYAALCKKAGVPLGSNILINNCMYRIDDKRAVFEPFVFSGQTLWLEGYQRQSYELELHGVLKTDEVPWEILYSGVNDITILVPENDLNSGIWYVQTKNIDGFIDYALVIARELPDDESALVVEFMDVKTLADAMINMNRTFMLFIYGFVGMLILISLTNVISTVSTNVRSRAREFAILKSVGMTPEGLKRMLNLESILCSFRSLTFGLPLGSLASWLIYRFVIASVDFAYQYPWHTAVQCIAGVLIITWITMRHAVSRLRDGNIIETIRA
jgi:putative ABC transport system permease protein